MRWSLHDIAVRYRLPDDGTVTALQGLSLDIQSGDRIAVVGHNGSGKSTLARVLAGIIIPTRGRVSVFGGDTDADFRQATDTPPPPTSSLQAALVLQNPEDNLIGQTVREELELTLGPIRGRANDAVVVRGLSHFGLYKLLDRRTAELSGGEIQRVALACGLLSGRQMVVLDEPTSHLDPPSRKHLIAWLLSASDLHPGLSGDPPAIVLITQYPEEARQFPRVVHLHDGAIVYDGPSAGWKSPQLTPDMPRETGEFRGVNTVDEVDRVDRVDRVDNEPLMTFAIVGISRTRQLTIHKGDRIALIGPIGSGKTTLGYRLAGLLKDPDALPSGAAQTQGADPPVVQIQFPERQLFAETVRADVAFGPRNQRRTSQETDSIVQSVLDQVGLGDRHFEDRSPFSLSGGQKHRVAMAGVIACRAPLYILDEPTGALDGLGVAVVNRVLRGWSAAGIPYVVISHDLEWLQTVTWRVWVLSACQLLADSVWGTADCRSALEEIDYL